MAELNEREKGILMEEIEARGGRIPKGGKREGAGRPRGSTNKMTRTMKSKERTIKDRVTKNLTALINSQLSLAKGQQFLYEIKMRNVGGKRKPQHTLVTDPKKIKAYMDGDVDEDKYFYVTTKEPDNRAIESLLDRAFGKSTTNANVDTNFNVNILQYEQPQYITATAVETNNDPAQLLSKGLSGRDDVFTTEVQDSSMAQTMRENENSSQ